MQSERWRVNFLFFFNDTATTEIYTLSLHDALPISPGQPAGGSRDPPSRGWESVACSIPARTRRSTAMAPPRRGRPPRSEEHTSELQSRQYLVCRLLLEKKNKYRRH